MRRSFPVIFLTCLLALPAALSAQDSLLRAVASPGDGAFSLLRKHGADPSQTYQAFLDLNTARLGEDGYLYEGETYLIPLDGGQNAGPAPGDGSVSGSPKQDETGKTGAQTREAGKPGSEPGPAGPEATREEAKIPVSEPATARSEGAQDTKPATAAAALATYDIFGPEYAEVEPVSTRLEGAVFYLVSGHGGPDPGAMTTYRGHDISEDEYAYDLTLRLGRNLISHGALVYIVVRDPDDGIRDTRLLEMDQDEVVYPQDPIPLNQRERLQQRVDAVNRLYARHRGRHQRLIVTHVDSRSRGQNIDVFFYHHKKSRQGKKLAGHIHQTFEKKYARYQPGRKYTGTFEDRSSLYMVRKTHPPTAFVEIGNIRNARDQRRILDPDNRQALANWISEGVLSDYEDR